MKARFSGFQKREKTMSTKFLTYTLCLLLSSVVLFAQGPPGGGPPGQSGVTRINQAIAEDGGVTPGDTPGFPVTISEPGSYILTGNLTVPDEDTTAIQITVENVTLNLNGFAILGPGISGSGRGVKGPFSNITVVNGTVTGMGAGGIALGDHARVKDVRATNNGKNGILAGPRSTLTGNTAHDNNFSGIGVGEDSLVTGNTANNNSNHGISASSGSATVTGNTAMGNGQDGISANDSTVTGNTAMDNGRFGIKALGSTVIGNIARSNILHGLSVPNGGYGNNVLIGNNSGGAQVNGGIEIGTNICFAVGGVFGTICP